MNESKRSGLDGLITFGMVALLTIGFGWQTDSAHARVSLSQLQADIEALQTEMNTIQGAVDNNSNRIDDMVNQSCPQGEAVIGIAGDGSVICGEGPFEGYQPPPRPCSEVAKEWCTSKGWIVVGQPMNGNIVCTFDGRSTGHNCDTCSTYNIVVWQDGSPERHCTNYSYSTSAGNVYSAHTPCQCGDNLDFCNTWNMQNCIPD